MSTELPLVSLLIRSMDRPLLDRALAAAAAQAWPRIEIVVVAACGSRHRALPAEYRGRPLRLVGADADRRLDRPAAANAALEAARGDWLNFLDDDDELLPEHCGNMLAAPRPADARVLYTSVQVRDADGRRLGSHGVPGTHVQFMRGNRCQPAAAMFHRSLVDAGIRFDETLPVYEDYDFFIHLATRTEFHFVPGETAIWYAAAGDSGCGIGDNFDAPQHQQYTTRIRQKWAEPLRAWSEPFVALLLQGQQALKADELATACTRLEQALSHDPNDVNALNLCAMAHLRSGRAARAVELLTRACQLAPQHAGLRENLELARRA